MTLKVGEIWRNRVTAIRVRIVGCDSVALVVKTGGTHYTMSRDWFAEHYVLAEPVKAPAGPAPRVGQIWAHGCHGAFAHRRITQALPNGQFAIVFANDDMDSGKVSASWLLGCCTLVYDLDTGHVGTAAPAKTPGDKDGPLVGLPKKLPPTVPDRVFAAQPGVFALAPMWRGW